MEWSQVWQAGTELLLDAHCPGCGRNGLGVCPQCRAPAGAPVVVPELLPGMPTLYAGGWYQDRLRNLMLAAKERQSLGAVPVLARCLTSAVAKLLLEQQLAGDIVLLPIPTARAAIAERGLDLPTRLAQTATRELRRHGVQIRVHPGLALARRSLDQADLGRLTRLANREGAFRATGRIPPGTVVVVDDVATTGATLRAASDALQEVGRSPVGFAVAAATPKLLPERPR